MTNAVTMYGASNESVVVYQSEDGTLKLNVQLKEESVWLTQEPIATLFGTQRPAITKHLNNIFNSGELDRTSTCSILEHMGNDGKQRYSHCGLLIKKNEKLYVLEAENGVELTPIRQWLKRGKMCHHYRVMRLKEEQKLNLPYQLGGRYDRAFRFNNGKYYCSELVWELYGKNNINLCLPKELQDYHFLYLPMVQKHIKSRGFTMDQKVVAPIDLVKSHKLKTVSYGYGKPLWL